MLLTVWLQALTMATAGVFVPGSLTILLLLLLSTEQGPRNALGYAQGYLLGYTLWGVLGVVLGVRWWPSNAFPSPPPMLGWLFIALGGLLCGFGLRQAFRRKVPQDQMPSRLGGLLKGLTPLRAAGLGLGVTVLNFKNLGLFSSALAVVVFSPLPNAHKYLLAFLVSGVFCSSVIAVALLGWLLPRSARQRLTRLQDWLSRHRRALGIWAPLVFGLLILAQGVSWLR